MIKVLSTLLAIFFLLGSATALAGHMMLKKEVTFKNPYNSYIVMVLGGQNYVLAPHSLMRIKLLGNSKNTRVILFKVPRKRNLTFTNSVPLQSEPAELSLNTPPLCTIRIPISTTTPVSLQNPGCVTEMK